ncbi:peptidyl-prolyl cis-trans isomerase [Burkholderia dolosa]|uniref:peptidylprolyl isomerase n=1 Tax=Burkholderia dolosa TaxID=152500 RepID=A0A892IG05_9BURK|nr:MULTISPECIES: peptidylprolyl isomerase [Burkholderia]AKE02062.1 peptidylprolyl isomerase [Burkholderia cepacia]AJY11103.1 PPIC-type PPIASE domain protein [Burkholderia dolosa AU0158]AYZ95513.1 peptidylprolyl isomerase [Burkholderia dolosa]ETP61891.1 peptidyl-prolyl cis-trans isomerase [Burkholderia dolosa PC543]MBR8418099.1 peptidylprolyl isomerase [Burkholderia dolosa]
MNGVLSEAASVPLVVDGVAIGDEAIAAEAEHHRDARDPLDAARRALAVRELLRRRAVSLALLDEHAPLDDAAVDALLERELTHVPEPDRADCARYYARHPARFRRNDVVHASHVLFAVTRRVPLVPLRARAESVLAGVRAAPDTFEAVARASSNCPSAQVGGSLGQLLRGDTVPEFEAALFDTDALGVLPKLVNTRFGFHIVRIERRVPGDTVPFDEAAAQIAVYLSARVRERAMRQYVAILAGGARLEGVRFDGANGPLVQ